MAALEKSAFFERMADEGLALTYDDVRLMAGPSQVSPGEVDTSSRFSKNVGLKTPFVSAAMDTVTTSDMAIAIAKQGGIGVIHAGLSIEDQRNEVRRVKLHLNGLIENPVTVSDSQSLESVLRMCDEERYAFRTFPVIGRDGRLAGLLTQSDFVFESDKSTTVGAAMTPLSEVRSAPIGTTLNDSYDLMKGHKKKTLPLLDEYGAVKGLYIFTDVARIVEDNSGQYNVDSSGRLLVAAAVPTDEEAVDRVREMRKYLDVVVIDTAQGDSRFAFAALKRLKEEFEDIDVVVGNVSNGESAKMLADRGADGVKVGQGPGSICTTRVETGIGTPQVTAVYESVKAIDDENIPVCADGGIKEPGDIPIAIAAGASSVMMGSMFAGTKEAPGDIIDSENGTRVKAYRGMGSASAMRENANSRKRYGAEGAGQPLAEGVEGLVTYRGSVVELIDHYIKALRKSMSYVGAPDIATHQRETKLFRITNAGLRESHHHDISVVTK